MKTQGSILIAFILNLSFSVFEFVGGILTGSVAITSDAVHDIGDAVSIGISYFLERKSKKQPDEKYTYGYARYSVIGGFITTLILLIGSIAMIYNALCRLVVSSEIDYNGMIIFAVVGVLVNFCAALFTRKGESLNQKAVNLHLLEDVLGWIIVLVGAVVMRFTDLTFIDPVMSVGVSIFILVNAVKNLKEIGELFLEKTPRSVSVAEIKKHISEIEGVLDVHHIHIRSIDGFNIYATLHVISDSDPYVIKQSIRNELREHGIGHVTIEIELSGEHCHEKECIIYNNPILGYTHHCHHSH